MENMVCASLNKIGLYLLRQLKVQCWTGLSVRVKQKIDRTFKLGYLRNSCQREYVESCGWGSRKPQEVEGTVAQEI